MVDDSPNSDHSESGENKTSTCSNSERRRKLIRSIATTGGVAATGIAANSWIKPVVNSVALPAHAQTSAGQRAVVSLRTTTSIMDYFVSPAMAVNVTLPDFFCIDLPIFGSIVISILGQSSAPIPYVSGVPFATSFTFGGNVFGFTNVIVVNEASTIQGNINCSDLANTKSSVSTSFSGIFIPGSCAALLAG